MWWSRALLAVALLALGPAGCGFKPLYGKATPSSGGEAVAVTDDLAAIRVMAIEDRLGQQLRNALLQRLNPRGEPARPRHSLVIRLSKVVEGLGQQKEARATLGRMTVTANFTLVDADAPVDAPEARSYSATARAVVSFNYLGAQYSSVAMERDAEERAIEELSESIRRQLAVHFATGRGKDPR